MSLLVRCLFCCVVLCAAERDLALLADESIAGKDPMQFPVMKGRHSMVFRGEPGKSGFNLHSYVIHFDGKFWAMWSRAAVQEEDPDQQVVYATSRDGHLWSTPEVLAKDPEGPGRWIARGWFVAEGQLTALAAYVESAEYRKRGSDVVWKNLRLMRFLWDGKAWRDGGVYAEDCMNNFPPARFGNRVAMICRDRNMDVSVALREGTGWKRTPIANAPPFDRMDEPTWYADAEGVIHMIVRDNRKSGRLIRSVSRDGGLTWSVPVLTNYPDATSKNFTGRLADGRYYLINNPNPSKRDPLTISFSRDGRVFGSPRNISMGDGEGRRSLQYPHAVEHGGSLWVIYSTNKRDIEIAEVPLANLGHLAEGAVVRGGK